MIEQSVLRERHRAAFATHVARITSAKRRLVIFVT
jgi:hypothetical protein